MKIYDLQNVNNFLIAMHDFDLSKDEMDHPEDIQYLDIDQNLTSSNDINEVQVQIN